MRTLREHGPLVISENIMALQVEILREGCLLHGELVAVLLGLPLLHDTPFQLSEKKLHVLFLELIGLLLRVRLLLGRWNRNLLVRGLSLGLVWILSLALIRILRLYLSLGLGLLDQLDVDLVFLPLVKGRFDELLDGEVNVRESLRFLLDLVEFLELDERLIPFLLLPEDQERQDLGLDEVLRVSERGELGLVLVPEVRVRVLQLNHEVFVEDMGGLLLVDLLAQRGGQGQRFRVSRSLEREGLRVEGLDVIDVQTENLVRERGGLLGLVELGEYDRLLDQEVLVLVLDFDGALVRPEGGFVVSEVGEQLSGLAVRLKVVLVLLEDFPVLFERLLLLLGLQVDVTENEVVADGVFVIEVESLGESFGSLDELVSGLLDQTLVVEGECVLLVVKERLVEHLDGLGELVLVVLVDHSLVVVSVGTLGFQVENLVVDFESIFELFLSSQHESFIV